MKSTYKKREQKNNAKIIKQSKKVSVKTEGKLGKVYICENKQAVVCIFWLPQFLDEMASFWKEMGLWNTFHIIHDPFRVYRAEIWPQPTKSKCKLKLFS